MLFVQPEHDPFAPHEAVPVDGVVFVGPDADALHRPATVEHPAGSTPRVPLDDDLAARRAAAARAAIEAAPERDIADERDVAAPPSETRPLVESPVSTHNQDPTPAETEDDDQTPPPVVKRTRGRRGAAKRSPSRASKLAEELSDE